MTSPPRAKVILKKNNTKGKIMAQVNSPFLTPEQQKKFNEDILDTERHNLSSVLNEISNGWKYRCMCRSCNGGKVL
jgi:hypothetical protein